MTSEAEKSYEAWQENQATSDRDWTCNEPSCYECGEPANYEVQGEDVCPTDQGEERRTMSIWLCDECKADWSFDHERYHCE